MVLERAHHDASLWLIGREDVERKPFRRIRRRNLRQQFLHVELSVCAKAAGTTTRIILNATLTHIPFAPCTLVWVLHR